jgi:hypothetical protein
MRGGCARRIDSSHDRAERHLITRRRAQRLSMGSPALRWCAWARRAICRPLSGQRSRWVPLPTDLRPSDSSAATVPTVPVLGASRREPMGRRLRSAPRPKATWRSGDRSPREMIRNYARSPSPVKHLVQSRRMSRPGLQPCASFRLQMNPRIAPEAQHIQTVRGFARGAHVDLEGGWSISAWRPWPSAELLPATG